MDCSLKIKEALSKTSIDGEIDEPNWAELNLDPTNMSTIDRPQQVNTFPFAFYSGTGQILRVECFEVHLGAGRQLSLRLKFQFNLSRVDADCLLSFGEGILCISSNSKRVEQSIESWSTWGR